MDRGYRRPRPAVRDTRRIETSRAAFRPGARLAPRARHARGRASRGYPRRGEEEPRAAPAAPGRPAEEEKEESGVGFEVERLVPKPLIGGCVERAVCKPRRARPTQAKKTGGTW